MGETIQDLKVAVAVFDRADYAKTADSKRQEILKRFPQEEWPNLTLERYALGLPDSEDSFCNWLERRSPELGSIRGGSSRKLLVFKRRNKPGWHFDTELFKNEQEAWTNIRAAFVQAFDKARREDWDTIDDLEPLRGGAALRLKVLYIYFPEQIFPIYSQGHIKHFLKKLSNTESWSDHWPAVRLNRALLACVRTMPEFAGWNSLEVMQFLYSWADPRETRQVVKIAPGRDARFWDDCLKNNYICVGWDEVGDLSEFEDENAFRESFEGHYLQSDYNGNRSKCTEKARELWTLTDLEPGDIIVANRGTSHVLALGEVIEPGYEWFPERQDHKHIVRVKWDTSYAKDIPEQRRWALKTVLKVPLELYSVIRSSEAGPKTVIPPATVDPIFLTIASALERKGQVILYGPPGTGKTYVARRFAVWWLNREAGTKDAAALLADPQIFAEAERALMTTEIANNVWWVVANPKEWSWDRLFSKKLVQYRYGRLQQNYSRLQIGDLVVGYQATPDKRIVALARIKRTLTASETSARSEPFIELELVAPITNGLTYDELMADSILKESEPLRFRNQGTLFGLSKAEAEHLFSLLAERDPNLLSHVQTDHSSVSQLTLVTFHPSYSYEDFVEGFRPVNSVSHTLQLRLEDGIFKKICQQALLEPKKTFLILIDEINRAHVAKVFGELITLLEKDKRGLPVRLSQSRDNFLIPPNVYLLGTMNTADRSIKLLDAALRRRFAFVELMPRSEELQGIKIQGLNLDDLLDVLNSRISQREGREKQIGHSFFMRNGQAISDPEEFAEIFRQDILPLLQEYCYDNYADLQYFLGERIVDKAAQRLNEELLMKAEPLITALCEQCSLGPGETL
jgi:5-methylcytosine-specific restriction protein B